MLPLLQGKLLVKIGALTVLPLAVAMSSAPHEQAQPGAAPAQTEAIATVAITPAPFSYRIAGEFRRDGVAVNAPLDRTVPDARLHVMKTQVSAADYERCVQDRACQPLSGPTATRADLPAVGVSWEDATAYARWLSRKTGEAWRLPTDAEWASFAGSRFTDDAVPAQGGDDFSVRWIAKYDKESTRERAFDRGAKPFGAFGANEAGLLDLAGNVWEWTDTCYARHTLDADGREAAAPVVNCGVRVVEGQHRTYVTNFVRDARAGGCAVGIPPANLGFRLVRDDAPALARLALGLRNGLGL